MISRDYCVSQRERNAGDEGDAMDSDKIKKLEEKIADLKGRIPAHSVRPAMIMELEELEEELEEELARAKAEAEDEK